MLDKQPVAQTPPQPTRTTSIQKRSVRVGDVIVVNGYRVNRASLTARFAEGGYHVHETKHFLLFTRAEAPRLILVHWFAPDDRIYCQFPGFNNGLNCQQQIMDLLLKCASLLSLQQCAQDGVSNQFIFSALVGDSKQKWFSPQSIPAARQFDQLIDPFLLSNFDVIENKTGSKVLLKRAMNETKIIVYRRAKETTAFPDEL